MRDAKKISNFILMGILVFSAVFFVFEKPVRAAWADHLVISEVQISGDTANDEFIELFNPTSSEVDLSSWSIQYRGGAANSFSRKNFVSGNIIFPNSFFLVAHNDFTGSIRAEISHNSFRMSDTGGTICLVNNQTSLSSGVETSIVDKVAYGSGTLFPEANGPAFTPAPIDNQSLERKASSYSTVSTLASGGQEESAGNGWDTDNNFDDLVLQTTPNPQNTTSTPETDLPLTGPPPVCDNDGTCETERGENSENCLTDCPLPPPGGGGGGGYSSSSSSVNPSDIVINEFVSDPVDGETEWLELYNNKNEKINLENWFLEDGSETKTKLSGEIQPKDFFVISDLKFYLNNKGDIILLKDASGNLIDSVTYGDWKDSNVADNAPAPNDPTSASRIKDGQDTNNDLNDFDVVLIPTKGKTNSSPIENENNTVATAVYLNEVLPNPVGDDEAGEFIELKNFGDSDVDLNDWKIQDASESKYVISKNDFSSTIIATGNFFVLPRNITKIALNNSGEESLKIYNANNQLVDSLDYEGSVPEGKSYSRTIDQKWQWTKNITSNQENIFSEDEEEDLTQADDSKKSEDLNEKSSEGEILKINLNEIREQEIGAEVNVQGVVSVGPGVLGTQIFYLAGSGIQIYFYKKDFPSLKIGDLVEVTGELAESKGESRIKISKKEDIKVIKHQTLPPAKEIKIDAIGEDLEGSLVVITGEMIEAGSNYFYLDDGTGEIKVYLKSTAKIKKPKFKEGDLVKVTGIVSQNDDEYRILPRFQDDMEIIENEIEAETEQEKSTKEITGALSGINANSSASNIFQWFDNLGVAKYFIFSTIALIVVLVGLLIKRKK